MFPECLGKMFIQWWNFICYEEDKLTYLEANSIKGFRNELINHLTLEEISNGIDLPDFDKGYKECKIQVLRSLGEWSAGISPPEKSIYNAYIALIREAKKYIYIENQFFCTSIDRRSPSNRIAEAIFERVKLAMHSGENFKVYIVLPVHPAGDIGLATTRITAKHVITSVSDLRKKLKYELLKAKTRSGAHSGWERKSECVDDYIQFFSLRNHGIVGNKVRTEQVYVHSKLLIVDDQRVIVGSANINDRSMHGTRDSEICFYIRQEHHVHVKSILGDEYFFVSPFVKDLRCNLWSRFHGISKDDERLVDATSKACRQLWEVNAARNTEIYEKYFVLLPTNIRKVKQIYQAKKMDATITIEEYDELANSIQGLVTEFPIKFLKHEKIYSILEKLDGSISTIPNRIFV